MTLQGAAGMKSSAPGRGLRGHSPLRTPVRSCKGLAGGAVSRPFGQHRSRALRRIAAMLEVLAMWFRSGVR